MRIGLFGGSFDPVHKGHVDLVENFMQGLSLDKVLVIPAFVSPFKVKSPPLASPRERVEMLKLAFEGNGKVEIWKGEIERRGVSYTVDTVRELLRVYQGNVLLLLLSEEMRPHFPLWKDCEEIKKMIEVRFGEPRLPISSTLVRGKLKLKEGCEELLPGKVLDYIEKHHLYSPSV